MTPRFTGVNIYILFATGQVCYDREIFVATKCLGRVHDLVVRAKDLLPCSQRRVVHAPSASLPGPIVHGRALYRVRQSSLSCTTELSIVHIFLPCGPSFSTPTLPCARHCRDMGNSMSRNSLSRHHGYEKSIATKKSLSRPNNWVKSVATENSLS